MEFMQNIRMVMRIGFEISNERMSMEFTDNPLALYRALRTLKPTSTQPSQSIQQDLRNLLQCVDSFDCIKTEAQKYARWITI